jgi:hypothetical protein
MAVVTEIIEKIPTTIPRMVSRERSLLARIAWRAIIRLSFRLAYENSVALMRSIQLK